MQDIEQLIDEMEQLTERQKELTHIAISNASKSLKRLGIICLLVVIIDILVCIIISKVSVWMIISMLTCMGAAIFDFHKSAKLARQAQEYKKEE